MAKIKKVKSAAAKRTFVNEAAIGSFELAMDSIKFFVSNFKIYLPLAAVISCVMVPAVFFIPLHSQDKSVIYSIYGVLNLLIAMVGFVFYINVTAEIEKSKDQSKIDIKSVVDKSSAGFWWYLWTSIVFVLASVLSLVICISPALIVINFLEIGMPVIMIFLIPGLYILFALFFAPLMALLGKDSKKHPIKSSWKLTRGRMLDLFFVLTAFLLVLLAVVICFTVANLIISWLLKLILGDLSSVIMAVEGVLFLAFLTPAYAIYGYKLFNKFKELSGDKNI